MKFVVTGGAGFIGSAVCRHLINDTDWSVVNLDKLTYAANLASLDSIVANPRYRFVHGDIADRGLVRALFEDERPDAVLHLAAESHVDRSIDSAAEFVHTNINGTFVLLEEARRFCATLAPAKRAGFRFHHVSTDEVFGDLGPDGKFTEATPYDPSSPYSASKAASDHLVRAWGRTYGLPVLITNCSNNYGPFQFPEKLVPLMILRALRGEVLPVYGSGDNVRDWLHVEDHADALSPYWPRASLAPPTTSAARRSGATSRWSKPSATSSTSSPGLARPAPAAGSSPLSPTVLDTTSATPSTPAK